jgi:hypothetical protein
MQGSHLVETRVRAQAVEMAFLTATLGEPGAAKNFFAKQTQFPAYSLLNPEEFTRFQLTSQHFSAELP